VGKVVLGLTVLVGFIVLALLRLGPDRIPMETWLLRRIRFRLQARRYTYQQPGYSQKRPFRREKRSLPSSTPDRTPSRLPLGLVLENIGIYPLVTVFLVIIGIYCLIWLSQGGAEEVILLFGDLFS
jgi:hypothetical protein